MSKLLEIDKLKLFLLDEDQIKLFDYVQKPILKIKAIQNKVIPFDSERSQTMAVSQIDEVRFEKRLSNAVESFNKIRFSERQNDKKLIEILD